MYLIISGKTFTRCHSEWQIKTEACWVLNKMKKHHAKDNFYKNRKDEKDKSICKQM